MYAISPLATRLQRLAVQTFTLLALLCVATDSFAIDVYRGLNLNSSQTKIKMGPGEFRFNTDLSLFALDRVQDHGPYPCLLRITLDGNPDIGQQASATDFPPYAVKYDNTPDGHYAMLHRHPQTPRDDAKAIRDQLRLFRNEHPDTFVSLIENGENPQCKTLPVEFN